jgi:outer membrane protein assembly factor BamD (BamD/ComL family)
MVETIPAETWIGIGVAIVAFWGTAIWALVRTLRQEDKKVELLASQDRIDSYSPKALADLREFVEEHPDDPYAVDARRRHNDCVETLRETDRRFYDWSDEEIASVERV